MADKHSESGVALMSKLVREPKAVTDRMMNSQSLCLRTDGAPL